ncbi:MAG: AtpZ/AtpI family protein [Chloroflexi bacterium]|nr:AtpZ/AtpI family protein [Chloroflexota bacterium]
MNNLPWWVQALRVSGLGWYVAACIILGILGGLWLDRHLGTSPMLTLVGVVAGTVLAFYGVYKMVQSMFNQGHKGGGR